MLAPVTILVLKEETLAGGISRVRGILDSFMPELIARNRNRVELQILG